MKMKLKPMLMVAAVAGLALSAGTASAVCVQEGFLEYSTHGAASTPQSVFTLRPSTGVAGTPSTVTYTVIVDWGLGAPACAGRGHTMDSVTWGLVTQGNKMRVRVTGDAAACGVGTVRTMGCFAGASILN
jgi:hypothetical protein